MPQIGNPQFVAVFQTAAVKFALQSAFGFISGRTIVIEVSLLDRVKRQRQRDLVPC